jgi:hypothetical protein
MKTTLKLFYTLAGIVSLANGIWMLASPLTWYTDLPAAVPDTGPFNPHFVRDIGVTYIVMAIGFVWCARHLGRHRTVHIGLALLWGGHALLHLVDILTGRLPTTHWVIDAPAIFIPALLLAIAAVPGIWRRIEESAR